LSNRLCAYIISRMIYEKSKSSKSQRLRDKVTLCLCTFVPLCLIFFTGCGQQQKQITTQIPEQVIKKTQTMKAAEDVLAQMHFTIEKFDYENGYIRTRPLSGAQFFEFWRSDNIGAENWVHANIHSIRRTVELYINQNDENINIDCDVQTQRLSLPSREIPGSAQAYQLFSRSSMFMQTLRLHPEQQRNMVWIDMGKDTRLEAEILKRISSMTKKGNDEGLVMRDEL
jgi:hypothetical protein